jgi:hypothetical protein
MLRRGSVDVGAEYDGERVDIIGLISLISQ